MAAQKAKPVKPGIFSDKNAQDFEVYKKESQKNQGAIPGLDLDPKFRDFNLENISKDIGKRLKTTREMLKITQSQMSAQTNICESTISAWENGNREVSLEYLIYLSNTCNVSSSYILNNKGEMFNTADDKEWKADLEEFGEELKELQVKIQLFPHIRYQILGFYRQLNTDQNDFYDHKLKEITAHHEENLTSLPNDNLDIIELMASPDIQKSLLMWAKALRCGPLAEKHTEYLSTKKALYQNIFKVEFEAEQKKEKSQQEGLFWFELFRAKGDTWVYTNIEPAESPFYGISVELFPPLVLQQMITTPLSTTVMLTLDVPLTPLFIDRIAHIRFIHHSDLHMYGMLRLENIETPLQEMNWPQFQKQENEPGYRQMISVLEKKISIKEAVRKKIFLKTKFNNFKKPTSG